MIFSSLSVNGRAHCSRPYQSLSTLRLSRRFLTSSSGKKINDRQRLLTLSVYRSLLRNAKLFSFSKDAGILSSLLHRTGIEEKLPKSSYNPVETESDSDNVAAKDLQINVNIHDADAMNAYLKDSANRVPLNYHEAKDLSRGYIELQRIHYLRSQFDNHHFSSKYNGNKDPLGKMQENAQVLYRLLLKEALSISVWNDSDTLSDKIRCLQESDNDDESITPFMRFPCQINVPIKPAFSTISTLTGGISSRRSESKDSLKMNPQKLNHTTLWDIIRREFRVDQIKDGNIPLPSKCFSYESRFEVALMALKELNQKKNYANCLGYIFSNNIKSSKTKAIDRINDKSGKICTIERNRKQAAKGVYPLSYDNTPNYLKPGIFLIAHPFLSGYFANTVICILDHTDENDSNIDIDFKGNKVLEAKSKNSDGGTYGIVINRNAIRRRPRIQGTLSDVSEQSEAQTALLKEVLRSDSLPEGFRTAFGDCKVREGGPVNLSLQMMHTCSPDSEEKLQIGGRVLPSNDTSLLTILGKQDSKLLQNSEGYNIDMQQLRTPAVSSDHAIFFQGDIIKAAQAVIDGDMRKLDFSFVVGASCWEPGQLEKEIKRGYWMPVSGPVDIAFDGFCQHEKSQEHVRHQHNLWLSMMCAIGQEEADLAHLFIQDKDICEVCDDF